MYSTHIGTNIIHTYTLHGIQGETGLPLGQRQTFRRGVAGTLRNACSNPRKAVSSDEGIIATISIHMCGWAAYLYSEIGFHVVLDSDGLAALKNQLGTQSRTFSVRHHSCRKTTNFTHSARHDT